MDGLDDYLSFLKRCKTNELCIRFLKEIGVRVSDDASKNYIRPFDEKTEKILDSLISRMPFSKTMTLFHQIPIKAFMENGNETKDQNKQKLKVIHFLLGEESSVTEENLQSFSQTEKYQELLKRVQNYNQIYEKLNQEYQEWERTLEPFYQYIESERKRFDAILQKKKEELYHEVYDLLPFALKELLSYKSMEDQTSILGRDILTTLEIEYLSEENMNMLFSFDTPFEKKYEIASHQIKYLEQIGFQIDENNFLNPEEEVNWYLSFLKQKKELIQAWFPSKEAIDFVSLNRKKKYEEGIKEYYTTRVDFLEFKNILSEKYLTKALEVMQKKQTCILGEGLSIENRGYTSIMLYTLRVADGGNLAYNFLHECGHMIDQNERGVGFEPMNEEESINPYDNSFRKYERFNEAINDMFTEEAVDFLHKEGIYLMEPKERTQLDTKNYNTFYLTKQILQPLLKDYREQVIKAKIYTRPKELIRVLGEDHYEELIDIVNKVDFLSRNGQISLEYEELCKRANQLYKQIKESHFKDSFSL